MAKRANGEGSVFQRKDGRWQGELVFPADGLKQRRRRTVYGRTQKEVVAKLAATREQFRNGEPVIGRSPTLAAYGHIFLEVRMRAEVTRGHNAESTLVNYRNLWSRHVEPDLGHLRLNQLTPSVLREWLARKSVQQSLHGGTLSPATQTRIFAVLRSALNAAVEDEMLTRSPLDRVKPPRGSRYRAEPLTTEETAALLHEAAGTPMFALLLLMAVTGARPGETLAAAWSDLDLDSRRWHISRSITHLPVPGRAGSRRTLGVKSTKTPASDAVIALPPIAVEALRGHRAEQARQQLAARSWRDPDLVFASPVGTLLEPRNALRDLKRLAAAAGITRNVRLHDLRHTAASALLAEGVGIAVTSKLLRHTRIATTSDVYSHLLAEVREETASVMDSRMRRILDV